MTITNEIPGAFGRPLRQRQRLRVLPLRVAPKSFWYVAGAVLSILAVWALAAVYLVFTPKVYTSRWTLIVPGAGQNTTVSLDSIGQSTTSVNSPYASVSLSPRVVYKELATSDHIRSEVARKLGISFGEVGRPRIKLIDETSLMMFELSGPTAEKAHKKALVWMEVFNAQLDALRHDELAKRSMAVTANISSYKAAVEQARQKITDIQVASGLVSITQFNEQVASLAQTRRRIADLTGEVERLKEEQARLVSRLSIDPSQASAALRLASDPGLVKVIAEYSETNGLYAFEQRRLGPENPQLLQIAARRDAATSKLQRAIEAFGIADSEKVLPVLVANLTHQSDLLHLMLKTEAQISGRAEELQTITDEKKRIEAEIATLSSAAAKLEDSRKDLLLAEAVYSSALARVDTSKSDIYGAYPILQMVVPPSLPDGHDQPRKLYALAGGLGGTLFLALAWGLIWVQSYQRQKRRKSRSS